jgi:benzoate/toluate 1,2-dioxygenase subunit beta
MSMQPATVTDPVLRACVKAFLVHEAELLDDRRYDDWIELFAPEGIYWVPANRNDSDPKTHVSLIYDDVRRLKERLVRAGSGMFWAQDPPTRTTRVLGNLAVSRGAEGLMTSCKFILVALRRGHSETFSGTYRHQLVEHADGFAIRHKTVLLIQNDEPQINLTFLP